MVVDHRLSNHPMRGATMRTLIYSSVFLFLVLLSLPTTSEAFSRRSSGSEVAGLQATTAPVNTNTGNAQAVPEPPVLMLMSIGLGVFGLGFALLRKS